MNKGKKFVYNIEKSLGSFSIPKTIFSLAPITCGSCFCEVLTRREATRMALKRNTSL